jgi:hypothetical protein
VFDGNQGEVGDKFFCNGQMNRDDSNGVKRDVMLLFEDGIGVNWYKVPG